MTDSFIRPDGDIAVAEQRAAISSLTGGLRSFAAGNTRQVFLTTFAAPYGDAGTPLLENRTTGDILYVEVRADPTAVPLELNLSKSSGISLATSPQYSFPTESPIRFLVYPGETLFAGTNFAGVGRSVIVTSGKV